MLNKDIIPIIKWLSDRGHLINMNTNGLRLDKNINELKEAGISRISISLYEDNEKYLNSQDISLLLQVHDELIFEILECKVEESIKKIKNVMEEVVKLRVPLVVDIGIGNNWSEAH